VHTNLAILSTSNKLLALLSIVHSSAMAGMLKYFTASRACNPSVSLGSLASGASSSRTTTSIKGKSKVIEGPSVSLVDPVLTPSDRDPDPDIVVLSPGQAAAVEEERKKRLELQVCVTGLTQ
jgi:hypothetical protein